MTVNRSTSLALDYARSVLGDLPKSWGYARVGDLEAEGVIADVQDGNHGERHPKSSDYVASGVPFVMAKDIINNRLDLSGCNFITREQADSLRIGFARPGDVLLTHKATMGRVAIVPVGHDYVMLTPQVTYYRIKDKAKLDARYLKYAFLSPRFQHQLNASSDQSTRKFIGITAQRDLWFPLPPIHSQDRIADILGTLDDKIELNRRMNETLEAMARRLFKSWFVDFDPVHAKAALRRQHPKLSNADLSRRALPNLVPEIAERFPDSFEDSTLGPIPVGWSIGTVGDDFSLTMGQSPPGETYNEQENGLPFYQGKADFNTRFPDRRVYCSAPTRFANQFDTLVSVRAPVGAVNMAREDCAIGRGLAAVRHNYGSLSITYYTMQQLSEVFKKYEADGTVFGSINKSSFAALQVVRAPVNVPRPTRTLGKIG